MCEGCGSFKQGVAIIDVRRWVPVESCAVVLRNALGSCYDHQDASEGFVVQRKQDPYWPFAIAALC